MRVQNNTVNLNYKLEKIYNRRISSPIFKSNEVASSNKLDSKSVSPLESGLAKLDKITKEEYDSLSEEEKDALRSQSVSKLNGAHIYDHYFIANVIRTMMDKQFGEGNYVIIPIGRSLSSVGKLLELQIGKDNVKNIPLSWLRKYYADAESGFEKNISVIDRFTSREGFNDFKKYLSSIGLDKETVENSKKNYVILDYEFSSRSINAARDILTSEELLGNSRQNVHAVSINQLFKNVKYQKKYGYTEDLISQIEKNFEFSRYKPYSFVGHMDDELKSLNVAIDYKRYAKTFASDYELDVTRHKLFGFSLLDNEFSCKKKLCEHPVTCLGNKRGYPNQEKYLWYSACSQLARDARRDAKEVYKVMKNLKEPVEMLQYYNEKLQEVLPDTETLFHIEFKEIKEAFNSLDDLAKKALEVCRNCDDTSGVNYYLAFRPMLFFKLREFSQRFSAENKTKILNLMEKRFDKTIKPHLQRIL